MMRRGDTARLLRVKLQRAARHLHCKQGNMRRCVAVVEGEARKTSRLLACEQYRVASRNTRRWGESCRLHSKVLSFFLISYKLFNVAEYRKLGDAPPPHSRLLTW